MAINLGMTAGISKEVDDGVQLVIETIVSTATGCIHRRDGSNYLRLRVGLVHGNSSRARCGSAPVYRDGYLFRSSCVAEYRCCDSTFRRIGGREVAHLPIRMSSLKI